MYRTNHTIVVQKILGNGKCLLGTFASVYTVNTPTHDSSEVAWTKLFKNPSTPKRPHTRWFQGRRRNYSGNTTRLWPTWNRVTQ